MLQRLACVFSMCDVGRVTLIIGSETGGVVTSQVAQNWDSSQI